MKLYFVNNKNAGKMISLILAYINSKLFDARNSRN